jgi:hypothetical protein
MKRTTAAFVAVLSAFGTLTACSSVDPDAPDALASESEDLSQSPNAWKFQPQGFGCHQGVSNKVTKTSRRHYYAFEAKAGQSAKLDLRGTWPGEYGAAIVVTDSWGFVVASAQNPKDASVGVDVTFHWEETHYVFVQPMQYTRVKSSYAYTLGAKCETRCWSDADCDASEQCMLPMCFKAPCNIKGMCVPRPICAEYVTSDGRYYAKNFVDGDWAAANAWVAADPQVTASGVGYGTCLEHNAKPCPTTDPPVCGTPVATDVTSTYASLCEFQKVVRGYAGNTDESKGKFTPGACAPPTVYCATAIVQPSPLPAPTYYYAKSFADLGEAKQWLETSFPNSTDKGVVDHACDTSTPCIQIYAPVCATIKSGTPQTYSNSCMFHAAVRADAGGTPPAESKGYYTSGACSAGGCDYNDPAKRYVGKSTAECAVIKFACQPNETYFADACGCGCQTAGK